MTHESCRFRHPPKGAMVIWELTRYCNLACLHCCTDSDPRVKRDGDLSTDVIRQAITEMLDLDVREFFFSGGEPLTRPDFTDLVASIDGGRADVFANTNGYYLSADVARRLATTALRRMTISIDGSRADIHAKLRGKPTSYDRAITAVRSCLTQGVPVRVSHVAAAPNLHGVEEFVRQMVDLGVDQIVVNTVFPAGRAARHPELLLDSDQSAALEQRLHLLRAECREVGVDLDFSLGAGASDDVPAGCPAGRQVLYIAADGSVSGCSWLYKLDPERFTAGNLHDEPFSAIAARLRRPNTEFASHEGCPLPLLTAAP